MLNGAAADLSSAGAVPSGTAMVLSAEVGGYEYALYRFNAPGLGSAGELDSVSVLLEDGSTTEAWIGIADYDASRWIFDGPFTKPKSLILDEPRFISPNGDVWVAVMVAAEQSATVNALSVRTINPANQPPTAALDADVTSGNAPLTVQFDASASADSDGTIIEYAWDFDGLGYSRFTDDPAAQHTFTSAGLHTVKVRVTDDQFARATATIEIDVNVVGNQAPLAHFSRTPVAGNAPLLVQFNATLSSDPDGTIVLYEWDFEGDGVWDAYSESHTTSHTYTAPGAFLPKLRVTDNHGAQATDQRSLNVNVEGNDPPVANFTRTPVLGNAPLFVTFDASSSFDPDGTIVLYEWDFEGDGVWDAYSESPTTSHTYTSGAAYLPKLRITDNVGAQAEQTRTMNVNDPPIASLHTDTPKVQKAETVFLDASGSSDPDGSITNYAWDLNGDGVFNDTAEEQAAQGNATTSVLMGDTPGEVEVAVRVTDDKGAQTVASLTLTVLGWRTLTVDDVDDTGWHTSLHLINGRPAIAYVSNTQPELRYAYSSVPDGTSGWSTLVVDEHALWTGYQRASLSLVNGTPAIAYLTGVAGTRQLKYARSSVPDGSSAWTSLEIDTPSSGFQPSLAMVNGKPAISYWKEGGGNGQRYAYSSTVDGSDPGDWTFLEVNVQGWDTSLALVNGKPAITGYQATLGDLLFSYSTTVDGSAGWSTVTVDDSAGVGRHTNLAVVNGFPAISYRDATNTALKYAYSSTADGSSGWSYLAVDATGDVGHFPWLAVINGKPAISYTDSTNSALKYAVSSTVDGSSGWSTSVVDPASGIQHYSCLAVVDGRAAISYRDATNTALKYAVLYD